MRARLRLLVGVLCVALSPSAFAWWTEGHECIVEAAASVLPQDMAAFFRQGARTIGASAMDPDLWTDKNLLGLSAAEAGNHFFDIEMLEGGEAPVTRPGFIGLCRVLKLEPEKVGTLPYAVQEWQTRLAIAFAEHRKWPQSEAVKAKVFYVAGVLSHYTGDACQPLHCTVHYDGRLRADGSSPRSGIHFKMDSLPGRAGLKPEELTRGVKVAAVKDAFAAAMETITRSGKLSARVYELEAKLPPAGGAPTGAVPDDVRKLAVDCCTEGTRLTATLWYSAWVDSKDVKLPDWHVQSQGNTQ